MRLYELENRLKRVVAIQNLETFEWEPAQGRGAAFGDLLHEGLKVWYRTKNAMAACQALLDKPYSDPIGDFRTKEKALRILALYIAHYGEDPQWEVIFSESAFEIFDPVTGIRWGGRIDLVVRWNDKLWVADHKSTTVYDKNWFNQFFPDMQTAGYTWAVSKLHGLPIYGAIVNPIEVNNNKAEKKDIFHRKWFHYENFHFEEFFRQVAYIYERIRQCDESGYYPPNWHACVTKYGKCSWYDFCRLRPENRQRFLERETLPNTWDFRDSI